MVIVGVSVGSIDDLEYVGCPVSYVYTSSHQIHIKNAKININITFSYTSKFTSYYPSIFTVSDNNNTIIII